MPKSEIAVFGGGCFWCLEAVFQQLKGVRSVESGFAGGHTPDPTYIQVCDGTTGHAEVVRIEFNPATIPYETLLEVFFEIHDPTTRNRQAADIGPQYRSIILTTSEQQELQALATIDQMTGDGRYPAPIVTEVRPLEMFYPAEFYHRDYYLHNSRQPYCQLNISPKLTKIKQMFAPLISARKRRPIP